MRLEGFGRYDVVASNQHPHGPPSVEKWLLLYIPFPP